MPAQNLVRIPDGLSFEEASAIMVVYPIAWHLLIDRGGLRPGERVLVMAAGGALGVDAIKTLSPLIALREDRIAAYALTLTMWPRNHAVADTEEDMKALLLGAAAMNTEPMSFLLPVRQADLFRWSLREGFRAVIPMTLMAMGKYQEPDGCYFPSILY